MSEQPSVYADIHVHHEDLPEGCEIHENTGGFIVIKLGRARIYFEDAEVYEDWLDLLIEGRAAAVAARDFARTLEPAG